MKEKNLMKKMLSYYFLFYHYIYYNLIKEWKKNMMQKLKNLLIKTMNILKCFKKKVIFFIYFYKWSSILILNIYIYIDLEVKDKT